MTSTSGGRDVVPRLRFESASTMIPSVHTRLTTTVSAGSATPRSERKLANSTATMISRVSGTKRARSRRIAFAEYTLK
jgi:hypothetical protein